MPTTGSVSKQVGLQGWVCVFGHMQRRAARVARAGTFTSPSVQIKDARSVSPSLVVIVLSSYQRRDWSICRAAHTAHTHAKTNRMCSCGVSVPHPPVAAGDGAGCCCSTTRPRASPCCHHRYPLCYGCCCCQCRPFHCHLSRVLFNLASFFSRQAIVRRYILSDMLLLE